MTSHACDGLVCLPERKGIIRTGKSLVETLPSGLMSDCLYLLLPHTNLRIITSKQPSQVIIQGKCFQNAFKSEMEKLMVPSQLLWLLLTLRGSCGDLMPLLWTGPKWKRRADNRNHSYHRLMLPKFEIFIPLLETRVPVLHIRWQAYELA